MIEVDLVVVEVETGAALVAYAQSAGSEEASLGNSPGAHFVHLSAFPESARQTERSNISNEREKNLHRTPSTYS